MRYLNLRYHGRGTAALFNVGHRDVGMAILELVAGFVAGVIVGAGGFMLYMQYRTRKQMQQMGEQMEQLMGGGLEGPAPGDGDMDLDLDMDADGADTADREP